MKNTRTLILLTFVLTIINQVAFGQNNTNSIYYLNSELIDFTKININPLSIDSLVVNNETDVNTVLIFTKNDNLKLINFSKFIKSHCNIDNIKTPILFKINGKILNDTTSYKIDDSYYVYQKTEELNNVIYLDNCSRKLTILDISLESKERKLKIIIKGN